MMAVTGELLLAYYGDDFTGSTDALEFLSRAGAKTVLFIQPPTPEQLARYEGLQAIGVAGLARAMAPDEMELELRPAFTALRALGAAHVHYKVCSTFDSSPAIGSIGKAIDIATTIFEAPFVPLLVAAPALGRYCAFGNLFARMGIGSSGIIYRIDRHPSMSRHPITPADEGDLRLHLARQTKKRIGLMDNLQVVLPVAQASRELESAIQGGAEVMLFDALYEAHLETIGELINAYATPEKPLFSVGSSGIEMALGKYWEHTGQLQPVRNWVEPGFAAPLLVVSGSCSPVTSGQISWALANGFQEIALDTEAIARNTSDEWFRCAVADALTFLQEGRSVIVHTSRGMHDARVVKTEEVFRLQGLDKASMQRQTARLYGAALGRIVRAIVGETELQRIVIAGGDTSSYAAREIGIEAVEMIAPVTPGAPLCKAYAPGSPADGLEVNFKGGQVGPENYFGIISQGKSSLHTQTI
ncbi:four-carbon acid sugar kinase family protein [Rufibacter tibetensis]|uniref:Serine kinase n=1 Tax=Rufibacter tibetensis TaxID=512763 RepID=A0A0P0D482_9BACT|nr:four-carbon acid sugar kinase family protein [Rufibacter tibetensis]ALJ01726.1 serine kinase [Rufibacter tibetensis]